MKSSDGPQFRRARADDAAAIERLYRELVPDPNIRVTEQSIRALEEYRSHYLIVGETAGEPIATAFLVICRDVMYGEQPFAVLENVVVGRELRQQGVGRRMMAWIEALCKAERCTKIMLLSSVKRKEAHAFFEGCGYSGDLKRGFVNYLNR